MPFYEYECASCKFYTEVLQRISDRPLKKCPSCGRNTLVKLVSAPVFRLKGGGWYETDFKSDKEMRRNLAEAEKRESKDSSSAEAGSKPEAQGKTESKTESKTAAASEKKPPPAQPASSARSRGARSHVRTSTTSHRPVQPKNVRSGASARARPVRKAR